MYSNLPLPFNHNLSGGFDVKQTHVDTRVRAADGRCSSNVGGESITPSILYTLSGRVETEGNRWSNGKEPDDDVTFVVTKGK